MMLLRFGFQRPSGSLVARIAGLLLWAAAASVQAQSINDAVAYVAADGVNSVGQGVFVNTTRGCVLVTAGHVVGAADTVTWRTADRSGQAKVTFDFGKSGQDLAILELLGAPPSTCPDAPRAAVGAQVASDGAITVVSASGRLSPVPLALTAFPPNLAFSPAVPGQSIQTGFSGAGVRSGGVLIGVATTIDNTAQPPKLAVLRFEDLPSAIAALLKPPGPREWPPFAVEQLPEDARKVALAARLNRPPVDAVYKAALDVALKADEAAEEGRRQGPMGERFATARVETGDYAGAITRDANGRAIPKGPGVLVLSKGPEAGRWIECVFRDATHCETLGRYKDKNNAGWVGTFCDLAVCSYGYYKFPYETQMIIDFARQDLQDLTFIESKDGVPYKLSEAQYLVGAGIQGVLVSWDFNTGKLIGITTWKSNTQVGDRTREALPPP